MLRNESGLIRKYIFQGYDFIEKIEEWIVVRIVKPHDFLTLVK